MRMIYRCPLCKGFDGFDVSFVCKSRLIVSFIIYASIHLVLAFGFVGYL